MSPDEGLRAAAERLATVADSLYHLPDQPRTEDDKRAIAAVINALAASGEGGSPSALRASAPEGLRADPGIDESLLHDIAGDPRFAATVSEYLSNRCTIGVLITATLRTAARVGYVPGHLASTQAQAPTPSAASAASAPEGFDEQDAIEYVDFLIRNYAMDDGPMTADAEVVRAKLRHLIAAAYPRVVATSPPADVVEIHAETLLRVVDYCRSDGPRSVLADCEAVLAFVAKANA